MNLNFIPHIFLVLASSTFNIYLFSLIYSGKFWSSDQKLFLNFDEKIYCWNVYIIYQKRTAPHTSFRKFADISRARLYFFFNLGKTNVCFCDIILKGESILFLIKETVTLHITRSVTQYSFSEWASSKRCLSGN